MTEETWELVIEAYGMPQAELYRSLLEAQGIQTMLSQEGWGHAMGLTVGTMGRADVLVLASQAAEARQILKDYYPNLEEALEEDEDEFEEDEESIPSEDNL